MTIPGGLPTGTVANPVATEFVLPGACASAPCGANFLFASETGNIVAGTQTLPPPARPQASSPPAIPATSTRASPMANNGSANFLYAADFANGKIDVFNS